MILAQRTRVITAVFFTLLELFTLLAPIFHVVNAESSNWVVEDSSLRSSAGGAVYPGSRGARLTVLARYTANTTAVFPTACLEDVPRGFQVLGPSCVPSTDANGEVVSEVRVGDVVYFVFTLNIEREVRPGLYYVGLRVSYYVKEDGSYQREEDYLSAYVEVSSYPALEITIKETYFTPYNYPGACPVNVVIGLVNSGETTIRSLRISLKLPASLADPDTVNTTYTTSIAPGEEVYLYVGPTCIKTSASPNTTYSGVLHVNAQLVTDDGVTYTQESDYDVVITVGEEPGLKVRVLSYELTSGSNMPGFKNTGLRVLIRSEEPGTLTLSYSKLLLENAYTVNGSRLATYTHNIALSYLESTWVVYSGLNLEDNALYVKATITLCGSVLRDNVEYPVQFNFTVVIPLNEGDLSGVVVEGARWDQGYAYPGSTGNTLRVTILNEEPGLSIEDAKVEVILPSNSTYPDRLVTYNVALTRGSLVEVPYTGVSVPSTTEPGAYEAVINITGVLRGVDNSYKYISLLRKATVIIANMSRLAPVLPMFSLVDVYWGETTPQYVYPGNARAPLTVVLKNTGILVASSVQVRLEGIRPEDMRALSTVAQCSAQLAPGESCVAVFYLDTTKSSSGVKELNFTVEYTVQGLGVRTVFTQHLSTSVVLPEYSAGSGIVVAGYGWLNNNPVFPRTKNAVLSMTLANLEAYSAYSMWISLKTPTCMSIHEGSPSAVYVAGPLASLQTTSVSFTLDLENCNPGNHEAVIEVDYYLQVAGGGTRKKSSQVIRLFVESDESVLEYITSGWVTTPVNAPVYGAQYYVVFRNLKFPSITNPVLKLKLPEGVVESRTNSREPTIPPAGVFTAQQAYLLQGAPSNIVQLLSQYMQQQVSAVSVGKGDFVTYVIPLNIETNVTEFTVPYTISFVDHWGQEYNVSSTLTVKLLTTPPLVEVRPVTPLVVFRNGTALLDVVVENKYESSISNLYLALVPSSANVIPQNAVKYIGKLEANSNTTVRFELIYNPLQVTVGTVPVTMSSAVFTVTLLYVDTAGALHSLNTTLAVMVKPFIELTVLPGVTARYSKGSLVVNGVLANTGISSARSVVVYLKYSDKESINIIGDIDAASQSPFRIELQAPYSGDTCTLTIKYRDEYGSEYSLREDLKVVVVEEKTETTTPQPQLPDNVYRVIVVVIVALFLAGVFYMLYRYSKRVVRRVEVEAK